MKQCRRVRQLARTRFVFPVRRLTADTGVRRGGEAREPITFVRQCYHKATGSLVANMSAEANLLGAGLSHTPDRCRYRTLHRMTRTMPARGAQFAKSPRVRSRASLVSTNIHQRSDRLSLSDMCYLFDSRVNFLNASTDTNGEDNEDKMCLQNSATVHAAQRFLVAAQAVLSSPVIAPTALALASVSSASGHATAGTLPRCSRQRLQRQLMLKTRAFQREQLVLN
jgi:hypothetical protein